MNVMITYIEMILHEYVYSVRKWYADYELLLSFAFQRCKMY